jgi:hypothetical protein
VFHFLAGQSLSVSGVEAYIRRGLEPCKHPAFRKIGRI